MATQIFKIVIIFWIFLIEWIGLISIVVASDLSVNQAVFTTGCTFGFREYGLRSNNIFKLSESMSLYFEPFNCRIYQTGSSYTAKLSATAIIESLTKPGTSQMIKLGELKFVLPQKDTELYADLTLNGVGDLPIDLYRISIILIDKKAQKKTSFSKRFRVGHTYIKAEMGLEKNSTIGNGKSSSVIFKSNTSTIYCNYRVRRIFSNSILKSVLIAEMVPGMEIGTVLETFSTNIEQHRIGSLELKPTGLAWTPGNYRLEFFIDEIYEHALQFRIE